MEIILRRKDGTFSFNRSQVGIGAWYCLSGRCPGLFGRHNHGKAVPLVYTAKLNQEAIEKGLATHRDLSRISKAVKVKSVRVAGDKKSKKKVSSLLGSFNPFSSFKTRSEDKPGDEDFGFKNGSSVKVTSQATTRHEDAESTGFFSSLFGSDEEACLEESEVEFEEVAVEEVQLD